MLSHGYTQTTYVYCVFVEQFFDSDSIIVVVDHDMINIVYLKKLSESFTMKDKSNKVYAWDVYFSW